MSMLITDGCINCGACEETCPTEAIREDAGASRRRIDPERCCECVGFYSQVMCRAECPVDGPILDPDRPESTEALLARARALSPDAVLEDPPLTHRA